MTARVVFVVGCPRSGTTLVQQLLNAHPAVRIGPETHFVHRFWQRRASYGDLDSDEGWERLVRDVAAIPELADIGIDGADLEARAGNVVRHPGRLLATLLDLFAGDAEVTGEKTPNHLLYMPLLQEWVPGARFIHVLRDPRAVVSSWRAVPWSSGTAYGDAAIWRHYIRTAEQSPPGPGTLLVVRYEALVADPAAETRRICEFLELPHEARMLEHYRSEPLALDVEREPWKRRAGEPISAAPADRWQRELTRWRVLQVEATVGGFLERSGYTAMWPRVARLIGPKLRALAAARRYLSRRSRVGAGA